MLKNEMESNVRIRGRGLKNLRYPYVGVCGGKHWQNHPYVISEWPLKRLEGSSPLYSDNSFIGS